MIQIKSKWFALLGAFAVLGAASASAQMLINGAGATFPQQIYTKWFDEYQKVDPSVRFNYQGIGSGGGQKQILAETVDFGASDGPMSDENLAKAPRALWHLPTVAGAVAVSYNLDGNPQLNLDGPDPGRHLPRDDHEVERPGDRRPESRTSSCPRTTSSSSTARTAAARASSSRITSAR